MSEDPGNNSSKCVMVIDAELPLGLIANTAAVLALTLGKRIDGIIGPDVLDAEGHVHAGITNQPIPILKGNKDIIRQIKIKTMTTGPTELLVVDFSNAAQTTTTYQDYTEKIMQFTTEQLDYLGIALWGNKKIVNKLTGSMPLLR
jgi:hypothetical protein